MIGGWSFQAKRENPTDYAKQRRGEEWSLAVMCERLMEIEHQEPTTQQRADEARCAAGGLHDAEGATLPALIDHLRREAIQRRTGEAGA